ncbi:fumarylacetoacetate hydrolase family protein [Profundibacterium mesophilum]|uniref:4-oxalocrotonate decarboxylase n=1 Tax=Profundibacterium mesophilum KAUST100406-0324 TaxID=1037889 RepID=A0A921TDT3_9RHOB|nr:2-keto-4-pentenoate hydratase [Profundibacterium mesophilum]KAF0674669.1 4-oxalocrotonate decarboxylase [Profundibacterium mesophilum KAUST100406-0324]
MTDRDTARRVEALLAARDGGAAAPHALFAGISAEEAYAVQRGVMAELGETGAFKIARKPGQPVIMAPIPRADIHAAPASLPASGLRRIGIELEIAFELISPLPPCDAPDFETRAARCVAMLPVIEIVDSRLDDPEAAEPAGRLADNQMAGALVTGPRCAGWNDGAQSRRARLEIGGRAVFSGPAVPPGGDAFATFCTLARMIGSHCGGLRPGSIVITGSLNGLPWAAPGDTAEGWIEGLGSAALRIAT